MAKKYIQKKEICSKSKRRREARPKEERNYWDAQRCFIPKIYEEYGRPTRKLKNNKPLNACIIPNIRKKENEGRKEGDSRSVQTNLDSNHQMRQVCVNVLIGTVKNLHSCVERSIKRQKHNAPRPFKFY